MIAIKRKVAQVVNNLEYSTEIMVARVSSALEMEPEKVPEVIRNTDSMPSCRS